MDKKKQIILPHKKASENLLKFLKSEGMYHGYNYQLVLEGKKAITKRVYMSFLREILK